MDAEEIDQGELVLQRGPTPCPGPRSGPPRHGQPFAGSALIRSADLRSSRADRLIDLSSGARHVLVFPDTKDEPSGSNEPSAGIPITRLVPSDLVQPIPLIRAMSTSVLRTAMPEAPVYEYRDGLSPKHNVGTTVQVRQRARMYMVAKPKTVEAMAQRKLWSGVLTWQALHPSSDARGRGEGLTPLLRHGTTVPLTWRLPSANVPGPARSAFAGLLGAILSSLDAPSNRLLPELLGADP